MNKSIDQTLIIIRKNIADFFPDVSKPVHFLKLLEMRSSLYKSFINTKIEGIDSDDLNIDKETCVIRDMTGCRIKFYVSYANQGKMSFIPKCNYIMQIGDLWDVLDIGYIAKNISNYNYKMFNNMYTTYSESMTVREIIDGTNINMYWYNNEVRLCTPNTIDIKQENTLVNGVNLYRAFMETLKYTIGCDNIDIMLSAINPSTIKNKLWCVSIFITHPEIHPVFDNKLKYRFVYDKVTKIKNDVTIKNNNDIFTILHTPLWKHPAIEMRSIINLKDNEKNGDFTKRLFNTKTEYYYNLNSIKTAPLGFVFEIKETDLNTSSVFYMETIKGMRHRNAFYNPIYMGHKKISSQFQSILNILLNIYRDSEISSYEKYFLGMFPIYKPIYENICKILDVIISQILSISCNNNLEHQVKKKSDVISKFIISIYEKYYKGRNVFINYYIIRSHLCCSQILDSHVLKLLYISYMNKQL